MSALALTIKESGLQDKEKINENGATQGGRRLESAGEARFRVLPLAGKGSAAAMDGAGNSSFFSILHPNLVRWERGGAGVGF
jgi:hypothetical protein